MKAAILQLSSLYPELRIDNYRVESLQWSMISTVSCSAKRLKKLVLFGEHKESDLDFNRELAQDYFSFLRRTLDCPSKLNDHERKQNEIELFRLIVRSVQGDKLSRNAETRQRPSMLEQTMFSRPLKIQWGAFVWDVRG